MPCVCVFRILKVRMSYFAHSVLLNNSMTYDSFDSTLRVASRIKASFFISMLLLVHILYFCGFFYVYETDNFSLRPQEIKDIPPVLILNQRLRWQSNLGANRLAQRIAYKRIDLRISCSVMTQDPGWRRENGATSAQKRERASERERKTLCVTLRDADKIVFNG